MPTCTAASLAATNRGYGLDGFNPQQYKAGLIYLKVLELAAIGGTDYSAVMTTTLISDANTLAGNLDRNQRNIAMLNIAANNAEAAGATVPPLTTLNAATRCCFQSAADLDAVLLLLECQLGSASGT